MIIIFPFLVMGTYAMAPFSDSECVFCKTVRVLYAISPISIAMFEAKNCKVIGKRIFVEIKFFSDKCEEIYKQNSHLINSKIFSCFHTSSILIWPTTLHV